MCVITFWPYFFPPNYAVTAKERAPTVRAGQTIEWTVTYTADDRERVWRGPATSVCVTQSTVGKPFPKECR